MNKNGVDLNRYMEFVESVTSAQSNDVEVLVERLKEIKEENIPSREYRNSHWVRNKNVTVNMARAQEAARNPEKRFNPKTKRWEEEDPIDNLRHALAGKYTAEAIANKFPSSMQWTGVPQIAGIVGANALGIGHEITSPNRSKGYSWWDTLREAGEDTFNNAVGSLGLSEDLLRYMSSKNMLPDGNAKGNMYFKAKGGKINLTTPDGEKHLVYIKESPTGMGKGVEGHVMVNHPTTDKGKWDTIDLTEKAGAKTVADGKKATLKWHKENPMNDSDEYAKGGLIKRADGSYSKRGLWDNIRANRGSGRKPTKEMLEQERKIKAEYKKGGNLEDGKEPRIVRHEGTSYYNPVEDIVYLNTDANIGDAEYLHELYHKQLSHIYDL